MTTQEITEKYRELRGCRNKRSYGSRTRARQVAKIMNQKNKKHGRVRAYACQYCNIYHVGHTTPSYEDKKEILRINKILKNAT